MANSPEHDSAEKDGRQPDFVVKDVKAGDHWMKVAAPPDAEKGEFGFPPDVVEKINDWAAGNTNSLIPKLLDDLELEASQVQLPKFDPRDWDHGAMENKGLNIFNLKDLTNVGAPVSVEEPVFSVETTEPFKAMSPLRYRRRGFLSL